MRHEEIADVLNIDTDRAYQSFHLVKRGKKILNRLYGPLGIKINDFIKD